MPDYKRIKMTISPAFFYSCTKENDSADKNYTLKTKGWLSFFSKNNTHTELARFILGGTTTMFVCWGSCILLVELLNMHYLIGNNIGTLLAWGYSYLINKYFVFRNKDKDHVKHGVKFILLQISLLALTNLNLYILVDLIHIHYIMSVVGNAILMTALNFFFLKFTVFKHN